MFTDIYIWDKKSVVLLTSDKRQNKKIIYAGITKGVKDYIMFYNMSLGTKTESYTGG